jgi:hypothetical protein
MSEVHVKQIIVNAVINLEYRELLFSEPEQALVGFDLTDEEQAALKGLDRDKFDLTAAKMEDRISRAGFSFVTPKTSKLFQPQPEPPGRDSFDLGSFFD